MYIDTSAAVKLYTPEPDSVACEETVAGASLVSSELLYCEFRSALLGKERAGFLSLRQREATWALFEDHVGERRIRLIPLDGPIVREASALLAKVHPEVPLRTLDALHLATFLSAEAGPFFTTDRRLRQAARRIGAPLAG